MTFVHLGCSGATVDEGLLGVFAGVEGTGSEPAQLLRVGRMAAGRGIDALVMSIGINDVEFGDALGELHLLAVLAVSAVRPVHPAPAGGADQARRPVRPGR